MNVNPIGKPKKDGTRHRQSLRWSLSASSSPNSSLSTGILFISCPRLKLEQLSSVRGTFEGTKSQTIDGIFVHLSYREHRPQGVKSRHQRAQWKPLDKDVPNFFIEPSLSEKFRLLKTPIVVEVELTSGWGFSLNPPPPPPSLQKRKPAYQTLA